MKLRYPKLNYDRSTAEVSTVLPSTQSGTDESLAPGGSARGLTQTIGAGARDQASQKGIGHATQRSKRTRGRTTR